jgi:hypothetical protein
MPTEYNKMIKNKICQQNINNNMPLALANKMNSITIKLKKNNL